MKEKIRELMGTLSDIMKLAHQRTFHKLENKSIYPGQPRLLMLIMENEGITQKELSKKNHVRPATITGMLKKLEANDYVYRMPDDTDKRIMRVYLTPLGRKFALYSRQYIHNMMELTFNGFSEEELNTLAGFLNKMKSNLTDENKNEPDLSDSGNDSFPE